MKRLHIFNFWERAQAGLVRELLEKEGIACLIRNEGLFSAMGEIPFPECQPELWVIDDDVFPRAKTLLENWFAEESRATSSWVCGNCGETLEGQFGACWKCGRERG